MFSVQFRCLFSSFCAKLSKFIFIYISFIHSFIYASPAPGEGLTEVRVCQLLFNIVTFWLFAQLYIWLNH